MGQNSCKGKGWVTTTSAKVCTDKGGKPASSNQVDVAHRFGADREACGKRSASAI